MMWPGPGSPTATSSSCASRPPIWRRDGAPSRRAGARKERPWPTRSTWRCSTVWGSPTSLPWTARFWRCWGDEWPSPPTATRSAGTRPVGDKRGGPEHLPSPRSEGRRVGDEGGQEDELGVTRLLAYNTGHRERYLADGSRPPPWRSWVSRHQLINV